MFNVTFYVGEEYLLNGTMQFFPRQEEKIRFWGILYQVIDVTYVLKPGNFTVTEVLITLKRF